jgi:hypothetical protein
MRPNPTRCLIGLMHSSSAASTPFADRQWSRVMKTRRKDQWKNQAAKKYYRNPFDYFPRILNNKTRIVISTLAGVAGVVSVFVYMHKRRKHSTLTLKVKGRFVYVLDGLSQVFCTVGCRKDNLGVLKVSAKIIG